MVFFYQGYVAVSFALVKVFKSTKYAIVFFLFYDKLLLLFSSVFFIGVNFIICVQSTSLPGNCVYLIRWQVFLNKIWFLRQYPAFDFTALNANTDYVQFHKKKSWKNRQRQIFIFQIQTPHRAAGFEFPRERKYQNNRWKNPSMCAVNNTVAEYYHHMYLFNYW